VKFIVQIKSNPPLPSSKWNACLDKQNKWHTLDFILSFEVKHEGKKIIVSFNLCKENNIKALHYFSRLFVLLCFAFWQSSKLNVILSQPIMLF